MKVLILSDANSIHTKRWVKSLAEKGINIILYSLSPNESNFYDSIEGVEVIESSHRVKNSLLSKLNYLKDLPQLKKIIKEIKPDIIHAHYASSYGLLGALVKTSIPYIISVWGSDVYDFPNMTSFGKTIIKYNLRKADYILSTSHVMAKETSKYTSKPITVTPFGVDINLFKPMKEVSKEEFVIGNVKTLRPKYGIDVLIKATAEVIKNNSDKTILLKIYGEGPQKEELIQLASSLGIKDKVYFMGYVNNSQLPNVYNSFSVAVSLSVFNSESFGVVAVEAMACGCPVITSDADGFTEVVENNVTGLIVPKNNVHLAAEAIQKFIDEKDLREIMGKEGRKRVERLYNWSDNVSTMIKVYEDVLSKDENLSS